MFHPGARSSSDRQDLPAQTGETLAVIAKIADVISHINVPQQSIAAAVEEQSNITDEVSGNVSNVSSGSAEIAMTIREGAVTAKLTTQSVNETQSTAKDLLRMSKELQTQVERFQLR
jgi:methyl-accepting chemotaxis protein